MLCRSDYVQNGSQNPQTNNDFGTSRRLLVMVQLGQPANKQCGKHPSLVLETAQTSTSALTQHNLSHDKGELSYMIQSFPWYFRKLNLLYF